MAEPGDYLFGLLAQSKGLPSHALRATESAESIPGQAIGGYQQGLEARQNIQQYKLLNTQLGDLFDDPSTIPYGLKSTNTVKDLMTIAPTMQNYIPAGFAQQVAQGYGANTGGGQPSSGVPPQGPTQTPPPPPQTPATPAPTTGAASLAAAGGAGADQGGAFAPGTQTSFQAPAAQPNFSIPAGGISKTAFSLLEPAMKASQEERLANERMGQERENFLEGQQNMNTRQQNEINAANNRTMAGETAKIAPSLTEAGTISDDINALTPLYKSYSPIPFAGSAMASLAQKSGTTNLFGQTAQRGKQIQQIVPALSAKVNYLLNKRFNSGEAAMLQQQVVPNATDNEQSAMQKIGNLRRLTAVMQSGDINALGMVASSIAGQPVNPQLPSSTIRQAPNPNIQAAIQWAQANPNDPRARAVLAKAQANGI
jgi:hypothetical protein